MDENGDDASYDPGFPEWLKSIDQTVTGWVDSVDNAIFPNAPTMNVFGPDNPISQGLSAAGSAIESGVDNIAAAAGVDLPSETEVWFFVIAAIVILVLIAYTVREVAG